MNKEIVAIGIIILVIAMFFTGIIPPLSLLENGTDTQSYTVGSCIGNENYELMQKAGYILSYKNDGFSEEITVRGKLTRTSADGWCTKVKYLVYLKRNPWTTYELMSEPGETSTYLTNPNPGEIGISAGSPIYIRTYSFYIIGNDYADGAIKIELWGYIDKTIWDWEGAKWYKIASDEAKLYSGYGGLYLPRGLEDDLDKPYSTFEIGQTVRIGVETAKGGHTGGSKPWRVTLNEPYSGNIDDPEDGGGVVLEKFYPNDCDPSHTFFEFTVTPEMAEKSMNSPYPYTVRIWNVLFPKGTLNIDFVDFLYKCPGDVQFEGPTKAKVGETITVKLSADVNSETQMDIDYFRVSVIYGTSDALLPSDWGSKIWILHTTNAGYADKTKCNNPMSISFKSDKESYVTVFADAVDIQGRPSKTTRTFTIYTWEQSEPPDDAVDDETGDHDYGGGHTPGWTPWDPSGGNWEDTTDTTNWTNLIVSIVIFFVFLIIALLPHIPIPFGWIGRILVIILGGIIAYLVYIFL